MQERAGTCAQGVQGMKEEEGVVWLGPKGEGMRAVPTSGTLTKPAAPWQMEATTRPARMHMGVGRAHATEA